MNILVIQNDPLAPSGYFGHSLIVAGAELTILHVYQGDKLTNLLPEDYQGLIVLGGRTNAFDDQKNPFLSYVIGLILEFHQSEKPIFGICLGAQLLARALGTEYLSNQGWEIGFTDLKPTSSAQQDPVFNIIPQQCRLYEMHEDSFVLPKDSELLMTGEKCRNQAFRVGSSSYGVQFHPELIKQAVSNWAESVHHALDQDGPSMAQQMLSFTSEEFTIQNSICQQLAERWLALTKINNAK